MGLHSGNWSNGSEIPTKLSNSAQFDLSIKSQVVNFPHELNNNYGQEFCQYFMCSEQEDTSLPITIDLTGPLPVIGVLKRSTADQATQREQLFKKFIQEAPSVPVQTALRNPTKIEEDLSTDKWTKDVSDINQELLEEGKKFIERNFFSVIFAHLVAIAFLLGVKPIQSLLLRTGSIHKKENTLKRYLSLIWTLKNLYECDLLKEKDTDTKNKYVINTTSKTDQELQVLRKAEGKIVKNFRIYVPPPIHVMKLDEDEELLLKALKADLSLLQLDNNNSLKKESTQNLDKIYTTVNPEVPLSQYDLAVVQFAFFGFISLFPKVFGIHESDEKHPQGVQGFIHLWGVLAKRLGLEDRFNLCLNSNAETNVHIFRHIFLFSFKLADENLLKLWRTMTSGSCRYFFFFRTKSLLHFMLKNVAQVGECHKVFEIMNCFEKFCYYSYTFCVNWLLRFFVTRAFINFCARVVFFLGYQLYLRRIRVKKYELNRDMVIKTIH